MTTGNASALVGGICEMSRGVGCSLDRNRDGLASALLRLSFALHESLPSVREPGTWQARVHTIAHKIGSGGRYLRQHDVEEIATGLRKSIRQHPGSAIMLSIAAGFLVGAVLRDHE